MRRPAHSAARSIAIAAAVTALFTVASCSGGGKSSQSGATGGTGATAGAAAAASAIASAIGSGGPLDVSKLCAAVPAADVQKLFKGPVPALVAAPGECDWGSGAVTVDIYVGDASKQYYNGGGVHDGTSISGIGDIAQWAQPVEGATVPFLSAHKGTTTVTVSPGLDVSDTTMSYTGSSPFFKIPAASALQYIREEGQICNDIFAAAGS